MRTVSDIYDRYAKMIYFTAFGLCHDGELASDGLQTVFLRVMQHERMVVELGERQLRAWLCKVTRNAMLDMIKKSARETPVEGVGDKLRDDELPEEQYIQKCESKALLQALGKLPALYRAPIELCYFAELSGKEAAKVLGVKESTLRSRILRGKGILQNILLGKEDTHG